MDDGQGNAEQRGTDQSERQVPGIAEIVDRITLYEAAERRLTGLVGQRLEQGADPNEPGGAHGFTPLMIASAKGHTEIMELLIAHGARVNSQSRAGLTPLHLAIGSGQSEAVRILLESGAIALRTSERLSPLLYAVSTGKEESVRLLLEHGANPNERADDGRSAIDMARRIDRPDIIDILLEHGARPSVE